MRYVGMLTQQRRNNINTVLLLLLFPVILLGLVWIFLALVSYFDGGYYDDYGNIVYAADWDSVNYYFITTIPTVLIIVVIWFAIAYFSNTYMIRHATGARPLERRENPRIYNIVENLCMTCNMPMPKINVIDDPMLNAFASGIDEKTYTVTVTTGIMDCLNDEELSGVVAHELTHIRNKDTRTLIVSIVFVGIFSTIVSLAFRLIWNNLLWGGGSRRDSKNNGASTIVILLIAAILAAIGYFFALLTRFAISRKREFVADAGGAELCGNPLALASALRKISADPGLGNVERADVAQLFIIHPKDLAQGFASFMSSLFATHPDTEERIRLLEQF
ncbi:MAG: M48 family metallopeptidase [Prevotellaceae bacterium]|nr:M48 family metallopeptidase [Prevotellaceae bacterium]